jgi:hypothetical protein
VPSDCVKGVPAAAEWLTLLLFPTDSGAVRGSRSRVRVRSTGCTTERARARSASGIPPVADVQNLDGRGAAIDGVLDSVPRTVPPAVHEWLTQRHFHAMWVVAQVARSRTTSGRPAVGIRPGQQP